MPPGEGELLAGGPSDNDEHRPGLNLLQHPRQSGAAVPQQVPHIPGDALKAGAALHTAVGPVPCYRDREVILPFRKPAAGEPIRAAHRGKELDHRNHGGAHPVEQGK